MYKLFPAWLTKIVLQNISGNTDVFLSIYDSNELFDPHRHLSEKLVRWWK
jgi:hypothetical protein